MELLKLLSTNEIVAQALSFLILLFLLRIFAWKRLLKLIDDRKERIALEFKQIRDAKEEITKAKAEYEEKLLKIEELAKIKIQEAVQQGKEITDEVRIQAHQEAQEIINNARDNIKYELAKAKEELKEQIVDLTISATKNVIQEKLTEERDKNIIREFLDEVDELKKE
jgi:F-type H+-transporting ATPase subunit b